MRSVVQCLRAARLNDALCESLCKVCHGFPCSILSLMPHANGLA